ncbi:hypothetical protein [Pseudomonas aeruginosa]|nr:hypothetical protein [Pseudomonas aeruginosa]WMF72334.1 hypothetical protein HUK70_32075 [Pseudomonas aeruginosa]
MLLTIRDVLKTWCARPSLPPARAPAVRRSSLGIELMLHQRDRIE